MLLWLPLDFAEWAALSTIQVFRKPYSIKNLNDRFRKEKYELAKKMKSKPAKYDNGKNKQQNFNALDIEDHEQNPTQG